MFPAYPWPSWNSASLGERGVTQVQGQTVHQHRQHPVQATGLMGERMQAPEPDPRWGRGGQAGCRGNPGGLSACCDRTWDRAWKGQLGDCGESAEPFSVL